MKKTFNISLITNKYFFISAVILLLTILTAINNYYFYTHIERSLNRNNQQLTNLLETEIEFCRKNRISEKRYKEKIINTLKIFSKYNYYNDNLFLKGYKRRGNKIQVIWKKDKKDWDKVSLSNINITIPKIKSKDSLIFNSTIIFNNTLYFNSIIKSMTFSIFEWIPKLIRGETLHWKTYLYRSRPAVGFLIFTLILLLIVKKREERILEIENELQQQKAQEKKKKEILETMGIKEQNDDIELYKAIMNNDTQQLKNIRSLNPMMNILKFNALTDHTEDEKYKILQILIEKGINLKFIDDDGMNVLMFYALGNENNKDSKIIQLLIEKGLDIDAQNKSGMTALMLCAMKNRPKSVQILIDNGANTTIRQDLTAKELAATKDIKEMIDRAITHNPKELVRILTNFTEDKPMKFTAHTWDFGELKNSEHKTFDGYMTAVKQQWLTIESDLKELSPNLYKKVYNFLWETDAKIAIGWSSLEGLKEWCDSGKNPFEFKNFEKIKSEFKKEIEIRKDKNMLEDIFFEEEEKLQGTLIFELQKLKGQTFYTDTEKFKNALNVIFSQMKERIEYPNITIEMFGDATQEFVELHIVQNGSESGSGGDVMVKEIANGDFQTIKENLTNLCDWSIESSFEESHYRVNYLTSGSRKDIETLKEKPKGFTHILRFYNK